MRGSAVALLVSLLISCTTPQVQPVTADDVTAMPLLAFLENGVSTREQVLLKLGTPSAQFEGERILTYQLRASAEGTMEVVWPRRSEIHPMLTNWASDIFSLVLVFDAAGVLATYSVVGAR